MDHAVQKGGLRAFAQALLRPEKAEVGSLKSRQPDLRSGPVLMGDLSVSICGRPLLLSHWDHGSDMGDE
jgi:hypothetical protein